MAGHRRTMMHSEIVHRMLKFSCTMLVGLCFVGCSTPGKGLNVFAPYRGATNGEEYRSPPPDDTRFTQAPTYPAQLLKPVVKIKDEESGTGLRRAPIGAGGAGMMPGQGQGF